jgi:protein-S-isoprenylcysteine O-methyltransferase Ste14
MQTSADSPGVHYPPPLFYAGAVIAGWLLDRPWLLTIAFALFLNTWWTVLLLVPTLLVVQQFVIVPEERYLHRRFGAEYEAYTRRVRRWL